MAALPARRQQVEDAALRRDVGPGLDSKRKPGAIANRL